MIRFTVIGKPEPAGSKQAFVRGGRPIVVDANKNARPWKALVTDAALQAMTSHDRDIDYLRHPLTGPLELHVDFYLTRPKAHYGKTGLRPTAPPYPTTRPDATKLLRGLEDSLTGLIWADDAQIVSQHVRKLYGAPARAEVSVRAIAHTSLADELPTAEAWGRHAQEVRALQQRLHRPVGQPEQLDLDDETETFGEWMARQPT